MYLYNGEKKVCFVLFCFVLFLIKSNHIPWGCAIMLLRLTTQSQVSRSGKCGWGEDLGEGIFV